jgi:hypothetical protein
MLQKKGTFNRVKFDIVKSNGYGQYDIITRYRGKDMKVHTTDSTLYDWIADDSDKAKQHEALKGCYIMIRQAYNEE